MMGKKLNNGLVRLEIPQLLRSLLGVPSPPKGDEYLPRLYNYKTAETSGMSFPLPLSNLLTDAVDFY